MFDISGNVDGALVYLRNEGIWILVMAVFSGFSDDVPVEMVAQSNATAGAEWLATRFGTDRKVNASHISVCFRRWDVCDFWPTVCGSRQIHRDFIPWSSVQPFFLFMFLPNMCRIFMELFLLSSLLLFGDRRYAQHVIGDLIKYIGLTVACPP
jgi:hypothetical protein